MADKGIKVEWIDSDTPGVIGNKVYRDDVEIADVGMGVGIYLDPTALENVNYKYEVQAYTSIAESTAESLGVNVDYYMISTAVLIPIMTNFRIEEPNTTRVFFDATLGSVDGIDYNDFTINGKTITGVNTTDNYFTLSANLTYWDYALTIRQENGNGTVNDFSMVEIVNYISEPEHTYIKYVDNVGGGNGDSVGSPWSISQANAAVAGTLVYIKAGLYDEVKLDPNNNGSQPNPIKYVGYKTTPGDLDDVWIKDVFDYVDTANANTYIDPNEWPVFRGTNVNGSSGIRLTEDYIIIKNIQVEHYHYNVWSSSGNFISIQNTTAANGYDTIAANVGSGFYYGNTRVFNIRTYKCVSFDNSGQNYYYRGEYHLFENNSSWGGDNEGNRPVDYYLNGYDCSFNVVKNNYVERSANLSHGGHGIGFKNSNTGCEYNLIIGNDVRGLRGEIYYAAHQDTAYNVFKENYTYGADGDSAVLVARNGAHHNLYENNKGEHCKYAVYLWANSEDQPIVSGNAAADNIFRNNMFIEMSSCVTTSNSNATTYAIKDNQIYGNTFYEEKATVKGVFWSTATTGHDLTYSGNTFKNNLLVNLDMPLYDDFAQAGEFEITYGNFFNNQFATPSGTGNVSFDPQFENTTDLVPTNDALIACPQLDNYDYSGDQRFNPTTYGGEINPNEQGVAPPVTDYDFYVSATGTGDGLSESTPMSFADSQTTINSMTSGQSIAYKGGDEFNGTLAITSSGASGNPIMVTSYGTGQASISGADVITGFATSGNNIWTASRSLVRMAYNDNGKMLNARYPEIDNFFQVTTALANHEFKSEALIGYGSDIIGSTVQIKNNDYSWAKAVVTAFNSVDGTITVDDGAELYFSANLGADFFLVNHPSFLSNQDDWAWNNNVLSVYSTTVPSGIEASDDSHTITTTNSDYITLDNLIVKNGNHGVDVNSSDEVIIQNSTVKDNWWRNISINSGSQNSYILNNDVSGASQTSIHNTAAAYTYHEVIGNNVHDTGLQKDMSAYSFWQGNGLSVQGLIKGNTINNVGYNGMISDYRGYTIIEENFITNWCQNYVTDGSGIYVIGPDNAGMIIRYNTLIGNKIEKSAGTYTDDSSAGITLIGNNISSTGYGHYFHNTNTSTFNDNTIHDCIEGIYCQEDNANNSQPGNMIDNTGDNNIVLQKDMSGWPLKMSTSYPTVLNFLEFTNSNYYHLYQPSQIGIKSANEVNPSNSSPNRGYRVSTYQTTYPGEEVGSVGNTTFIQSYTTATEGSNLVTNGDFESGTTGWSFFQGGTLTIENDGDSDYLVITPTNYSIVRSPSVSKTTGTQYEIKFKARATADFTQYIAMSGETNIPFNITDEWNEYAYTFEATTSGSFQIEILCYDNTGILNFDDIEFREVTLGAFVDQDFFAYNETSVAKDVTLPSGTWDSIDGTVTNANGTVSVPAYSSYIMIKSDLAPPSELYPEGNAASITGEADSIGLWEDGNESSWVLSQSAEVDNSNFALDIEARNVYGFGRSTIAVTNGNTYRFTFRIKRNEGFGDEQQIYGWTGVVISPDELITQSGWNTYTYDVVANSTEIQYKINATRGTYTVGAKVWVDNISITDLGVV